jgi:hypothetical protein
VSHATLFRSHWDGAGPMGLTQPNPRIGATVAAKSEQIKPIIVLIVCLFAVAVMFVGSIVISTLVVQAERSQPPADSSTTQP